MIRVRAMTECDLPLGMRLTGQAGWNQTAADWRRILHLEPGGCFVAEAGGSPVATAAVCTFDSVAWVMMLLVDEGFRRRGIGTRLIEHCLEVLDQRSVRTTRLDATSLGRPIYEKLGFLPEYEVVRLEGTAEAVFLPGRVEPVAADRLGEVCEFDRRATGTDRGRLIKRLYEERPDAMQLCARRQEILGYLTFREGSRAVQIGPGAARSAGVGRSLVEAVLARCAGRRVFWDVPVENRSAVRFAEAKDLAIQRSFVRMRRGAAVDDQRTLLWASFGPEKG